MVKPTIAEFLAHRANRRRGCAACLVLASLEEHFYCARPELASMGIGEFKDSIRKANWTVRAIADLAIATKHVVPERNKGGWAYKDMSIHQINVMGIQRCGWPRGAREVLVGVDRECLAELLECAMTFWREKLGILAEVA